MENNRENQNSSYKAYKIKEIQGKSYKTQGTPKSIEKKIMRSS